MIKKLETSDIAQILRMDDPIEKIFPCDKGAWIQWLNQYVDHPEIYMIGRSDNGHLVSYAVAISMVTPPLSKAVTIIFMSDPLDGGFRTEISSWAKQKGAEVVMLQAKAIEILKTLGADEISYMGTWRV